MFEEIFNNEIEINFIRASGPGGQNVNKVATAVQLRFNAAGSPSLAPEHKKRLIKLAGSRATAEGVILIEAKHYRTQEANRQDAINRLIRLLEKALINPKTRHKTKPTLASYTKRLNKKKQRSQLKQSRHQNFEE